MNFIGVERILLLFSMLANISSFQYSIYYSYNNKMYCKNVVNMLAYYNWEISIFPMKVKEKIIIKN